MVRTSLPAARGERHSEAYPGVSGVLGIVILPVDNVQVMAVVAPIKVLLVVGDTVDIRGLLWF